MSDTRNDLLAAMERLPGVEQKRHRLNDYAFQLELVAGIMAAADLPRANEAGSRVSRAELAEFSKRAAALRDHILGMHREALSVLEASGAREWLLLKDDLAVLIQAANKGVERIGHYQAPGPKGRPRKQQAAEIARIAAVVYRKITGHAPTVTTNSANCAAGLWFEFLRDILVAFNIQASAERLARNAAKEKRPAKNGD